MSLEEKRNLIKSSETQVAYGHTSARRAVEVAMATHRGNGVVMPSYTNSAHTSSLAQHKRLRDRKPNQFNPNSAI